MSNLHCELHTEYLIHLYEYNDENDDNHDKNSKIYVLFPSFLLRFSSALQSNSNNNIFNARIIFICFMRMVLHSKRAWQVEDGR